MYVPLPPAIHLVEKSLAFQFLEPAVVADLLDFYGGLGILLGDVFDYGLETVERWIRFAVELVLRFEIKVFGGIPIGQTGIARENLFNRLLVLLLENIAVGFDGRAGKSIDHARVGGSVALLNRETGVLVRLGPGAY